MSAAETAEKRTNIGSDDLETQNRKCQRSSRLSAYSGKKNLVSSEN